MIDYDPTKRPKIEELREDKWIKQPVKVKETKVLIQNLIKKVKLENEMASY
jgi:hypothetical protein